MSTEPPLTLQEQADRLATLLAGFTAEAWQQFADEFLEAPTVIQRVGEATVTMTTRSGTVLAFQIAVLEP